MRDQVTGMTYSDGTPAVTMSYDAAGRPLEIGNAVATDAYAYDDAGQLAVETQSVAGHPAGMRPLTHSFDDADGLRTGLVYPGGNVLAAGYTARGQLATMTFHGQPVATSTYRPNGQPIGTVYGNGAQRTLTYDAARLFKAERDWRTAVPSRHRCCYNWIRALASCHDRHPKEDRRRRAR
jgi:YD repeat-containing protein